jgi:hypothetical protein
MATIFNAFAAHSPCVLFYFRPKLGALTVKGLS